MFLFSAASLVMLDHLSLKKSLRWANQYVASAIAVLPPAERLAASAEVFEIALI
jgi:hypothetical protein